MSTAEKSIRVESPSLVEGTRIDQAEFHRRYEAMPPGTRAQLINGVVHMPSPVGIAHGEASATISTWLALYCLQTPGVQVLDGATTLLGRKSEPQPDTLLRILPEYGGQTRDERGFVRGGPELVVEVSKATRYVDLGPKRDDYEQGDVREYLVRALDPDEVIWHMRREGGLEPVLPDADGFLRSEVFPGLWLDPQALLANDLGAILVTLNRGLASPEHAEFVARLAAARVTP